MHTSPTPLTCALAIIRDADLSELGDIKDSITTSLLADIAANPKRPPTGDVVLDEVRGWVDDYKKELLTTDRLKMLKLIVRRQEQGNKPVTGGITDSMIQAAREVPIETMIDTRVFNSTGKWIACTHCPRPSHGGERTPSFYIDKQNKWRCFGCSSHGDSIDLYIKMNGVNFIQAVKKLST